jgi:hypothetical protein
MSTTTFQLPPTDNEACDYCGYGPGEGDDASGHSDLCPIRNHCAGCGAEPNEPCYPHCLPDEQPSLAERLAAAGNPWQ